MSGYLPFASGSATAQAPVYDVDTIFGMGMASLAANNNQIVLPEFMGDVLGQEKIVQLKQRLRLVFPFQLSLDFC